MAMKLLRDRYPADLPLIGPDYYEGRQLALLDQDGALHSQLARNIGADCITYLLWCGVRAQNTVVVEIPPFIFALHYIPTFPLLPHEGILLRMTKYSLRIEHIKGGGTSNAGIAHESINTGNCHSS